MAGITLEQAAEQLSYWLDINKQLGPNAEQQIGDKRFKRTEALYQIKFWQNEVVRLSRASGGISVKQVIPV